jgi:hypothetical protein
VVDIDPAAAREHWEKALVVFRRMGVPERWEVERRLAASAIGDSRLPRIS